MKGSIFVLVISLLYVSCKSDNDMHYKNKENKAENPVGIQNVNGNIPDTINTVNISKPGENSKLASDNDEQKNVSGTTPVR